MIFANTAGLPPLTIVTGRPLWQLIVAAALGYVLVLVLREVLRCLVWVLEWAQSAVQAEIRAAARRRAKRGGGGE